MLRAVLALLLASVANAADLEQQMLAIQGKIRSGDLMEASRLVEDALSSNPGAGGLFNLRGIIYAEQNELPAARSAFAQAVKLSPDLTPAWANLAHACQAATSGAPACGAAVWHSLKPAVASELGRREDFTDADFDPVGGSVSAQSVIPTVEALDARHAAGLASLRRLAIAYEEVKQPEAARRVLERVASLDPQNVAHLLELARLADLCHDEEGALGYLAHARDLAPQNPQIHYLFAMIANKMDLPIEARASLQKALAIDPANPDYNYAMGFVLLSTRDAATSASYFEKFVAARPDNVKGRYALGIAYYSSGDYSKCKVEMNRVKGNPATAGGAEYFLGRMARQEENFAAAKTHLLRSIDLLPTFAESHTELARVLMSEDDLPGARVELERALAIDRSSFPANSQLLAIYLRTKDPRASAQQALVKTLDERRSKRAELMLRTIEARPEP